MDGERVTILHGSRFQAADYPGAVDARVADDWRPREAPLPRTLYRRETLSAAVGHEVVVWVDDDLSNGEALQLLVDGYMRGPAAKQG